jgi:hypothetical protein
MPWIYPDYAGQILRAKVVDQDRLFVARDIETAIPVVGLERPCHLHKVVLCGHAFELINGRSNTAEVNPIVITALDRRHLPASRIAREAEIELD